MKTINVEDYASAIELNTPYQAMPMALDENDAREMLWRDLEPALTAIGAPERADCDVNLQRQWIDAAITLLQPNELSPEGVAALDALLMAEEKQREMTSIASLLAMPFLTIGNTKIVLWKGDITTLEVDAIVNAANHQMLGCFQPGHKCIDNAIHSRAGVQLRRDCNTIMEIQGHDEAAGQAKITRGYHLPARYVIHTVGPVVSGIVQEADRATLASSYRSVLDISQKVSGIDSLALCSISTGVYGYPIEQATPIAIQETVEWIKANPNKLNSVVFNVFSDRDYVVYQSLLEEFVCQQ